MEDTYLTTPEVSAWIRTPPETLRYWRHIGKGPASFRIGRRVLYARRDVADWLEAQRKGQGGDAA